MTPASFIDANIPIYAVGRPHPLKDPCSQILLLIAQHPAAFLTSAEVLQEFIHHYLALRMWVPQGQQAFRRFSILMQERIEPVYAEDVQRAAALADAHQELAARDLLHAAVMQRLGVSRIVSADRDFDRLPGIERLDPALVATWQSAVMA
ncbi:MAG: type II toxin-antitoxin system VapC family toxin [Chloroflexi bacterium]|nr:type II toxin-antitoxin system VapC family toxin [Chloroflexota bacterium]